MPHRTHDVAVVGAGVFGAWIALSARRAGLTVLLLDAHGAGHPRASSGGESRLIRAGYGTDELYASWARQSLPLWKRLEAETGERLFHETGVLWMARSEDALSAATLATLARLGVPHERVDRAGLEKRFPQVDFGPVSWGIFERESGVLMARRAVRATVSQAVREGVEYRIAAAAAPARSGGHAGTIVLEGAGRASAGAFVFAAGPWLGRLFPDLLGDRIFPTRQDVFYFGPPPGDTRFAPPALPAWIDFGAEIYGVPDVESGGFKIAPDRHGPRFDPELGERVADPAVLAVAREYLAARFPGLRSAPLVRSEVCQYENTSSGDFLIDRHPGLDDVWLVGGGSGHGFKHGPAVGSYVAARISGRGPVEARFGLATKDTVQQRAIF